MIVGANRAPPAARSIESTVRRMCFLLERISDRGYSYHDGFTRVLAACLQACDKVESGAADRLGWWPDGFDDAREELAEFFGLLLTSTIEDGEPTYHDVIGQVYMEFGRGRPHLGQYFTPDVVCRAMAEMTLGDDDLTRYSAFRPMTVCDPCCGSGRMLLAAAKVLPPAFVGAGCLSLHGQDLDRVCVDMAMLNLRLYGLHAPRALLTTRELTDADIARYPEGYQETLTAARAEQLAMVL